MKDMWLSDLVKGWSPALRAFFVGLARNGLSARPEEIPLSGFIAFLRFYSLLRRDSWAFSYLPADGDSSLIEPLRGKLTALGGEVRLGARVARLEREGEGWRVCLDGGGSVCGQQVILAVDAPGAAQILSASPAMASVAPDLYWPRGMATAVVRLWFDKPPRPGAEAGILSGDFVADNFFWLHRIQDEYVRWHRATGGSAIEVHIYGPPALLKEPDAALLTRVIVDVQSAFPELRGHRLYQMLRRNEPTHTLFGLGPQDRHLGIETIWPNLFCCGDWVNHPSPSFFLERACTTGIEAANAVLKSRQLPVWPLLGYAPPEPFCGFLERVMHWGRGVMRRFAK